MEASTAVTIRDSTAIIPALNGTSNLAKDNIDVNSASLNDSSYKNGSNNSTGGPNRTQQQKITNGTAATQSQMTTVATPEPNNSARQKRAAAGVELKSMIIEFMRDKPYLWNRWHPGYNDNKRRENEFTLFSHDINYPVSEIKRVWHVLRTNFFRAHKIQAEKGINAGPDNGERCWKYYQSMKFILQGAYNNTSDSVANNNNNSNNNNVTINDDSSSSIKEIRQTRSSKILKVARGSRRTVQRITQPPINSISDSSNNSSNAPSALTITATTATNAAITTTTTAIISNSTPMVSMASDNITFSTGAKSAHGRSLRAHRDDNHDISTMANISPDQFGLAHGRNSTLSAFNEMSRISFDADDDHLYARSLTSTLKKFDPTTKEVIKLKFQEIIVEYMQKHQQQLHLYQQQQQHQPAQATTTTTQPKQTQE